MARKRLKTLTGLPAMRSAIWPVNPLKQNEAQITKRLRRSGFYQMGVVGVGAFILLLIANFVTDGTITSSSNIDTMVLSEALKPLIRTVKIDDPDTFDGLNRVLQGIKKVDPRIDRAYIVHAESSKILAVMLKDADESHTPGKRRLLTKAESKLIGQEYPAVLRLKGLREGFREFTESNGTLTNIAPVVFSPGTDNEKVKAYVHLTLNNDARDRAWLLLMFGMIAILCATLFNQYRANRILKVMIPFTNVPAAEKVLSDKLNEGPEHIDDVIVGQIDIKDSTKLANTFKKNPKKLFAKLNKLFSIIGWILGDFGLTLDKLIGDAVLFLVKVTKGMNKETCARLMATVCTLVQYAIAIHNYVMVSYHGDKPLYVRIGLAIDECIQGALGAPGVRMDYTLIGWVVNLAVRIESACIKSGLLISGYLWGDANLLQTAQGPEEFLKGTKRDVEAKGFDGRVNVHDVNSFVLPELCEWMAKYLLSFFSQKRVRLVLDLSEEQHQQFLYELEHWLDKMVQKGMPLPAPEMDVDDIPAWEEEPVKPSRNPVIQLREWRQRDIKRITAITSMYSLIHVTDERARKPDKQAA